MSRILASLALTLALAGGAMAAPRAHMSGKAPAATSSDFATQFFAEMQRNIGG